MPVPKTTDLLMKHAQTLFWPCLAVYVFTLPISHTIVIRNIAFAALILVTACLCAGLHRKPALPLPKAWAIYAGIALVSCFYAVSPMASLAEIRVEIFYCMAAFSIAVTWSRNSDILHPFAFIAAAANLLLVVAALGTAGFDKSLSELLALPGWARAGLNANYLLTMAPLLCYLGWTQWRGGNRPLAAGIALILMLDVLAMIIGYNRQALMALATGVFCAGVLLLRNQFTWRRCAALIGILLFLAALLAAQMIRRAESIESVDQIAQTAVSQDVRWPLWKFSIEKIIERPLSGGGFGRAVFDKLYPEFMPENVMLWHAHNMVLNKGIQMGIPGMLAFLLLWYSLLRAFTGYLRVSSTDRVIAIVGVSTLATIFVKNMTDDFFVRDMALWFWLVTGMLLGSLQRQGASASQPSPSQ